MKDANGKEIIIGSKCMIVNHPDYAGKTVMVKNIKLCPMRNIMQARVDDDFSGSAFEEIKWTFSLWIEGKKLAAV